MLRVNQSAVFKQEAALSMPAKVSTLRRASTAAVEPRVTFSQEDERSLCEWLRKAHQAGFQISKEQIIDSVQVHFDRFNVCSAYPKNRPPASWYRRFEKHNSAVISVVEGKTHTTNATAGTQQWLARVRKSLLDVQLEHLLDDPARVFALEECSLFMHPTHKRIMFERRDSSKVDHSFTMNAASECMSIVLGGSAGGQMMPPLLMYKCKALSPEIWRNAPSDWGLGFNRIGRLTARNFFEYISSVLYPWLIEHDIKLPIVLVIDDDFPALTWPVAHFCANKGIELVALPRDGIDVVHPIAAHLFPCIKEKWLTYRERWPANNAGATFQRQHVASLIHSVIKDIDVSKLLEHSFRASKLFPSTNASLASMQQQTATTTSVKSVPSPSTRPVYYKQCRNAIEQFIGSRLTEQFQRAGLEWCGDRKHGSLFGFWKACGGGTDVNHKSSDQQAAGASHEHVNRQRVPTVTKYDQSARNVEPPALNDSRLYRLSSEDVAASTTVISIPLAVTKQMNVFNCPPTAGDRKRSAQTSKPCDPKIANKSKKPSKTIADTLSAASATCTNQPFGVLDHSVVSKGNCTNVHDESKRKIPTAKVIEHQMVDCFVKLTKIPFLDSAKHALTEPAKMKTEKTSNRTHSQHRNTVSIHAKESAHNENTSTNQSFQIAAAICRTPENPKPISSEFRPQSRSKTVKNEPRTPLSKWNHTAMLLPPKRRKTIACVSSMGDLWRSNLKSGDFVIVTSNNHFVPAKVEDITADSAFVTLMTLVGRNQWKFDDNSSFTHCLNGDILMHITDYVSNRRNIFTFFGINHFNDRIYGNHI